jgi:hypothetical protein
MARSGLARMSAAWLLSRDSLSICASRMLSSVSDAGNLSELIRLEFERAPRDLSREVFCSGHGDLRGIASGNSSFL